MLHHLKPRQLHDAAAGDTAVRRLADRVGRIDRLVRVARADARGRPPLPQECDTVGDWLLRRAEALRLASSRPRALVTGRHLIARGLEPGPAFGPILEGCFEAQLDGRFEDLTGGLGYLDEMLQARFERPLEIKELPNSS